MFTQNNLHSPSCTKEMASCTKEMASCTKEILSYAKEMASCTIEMASYTREMVSYKKEMYKAYIYSTNLFILPKKMTNRNEDYSGMIKLTLDVWTSKQSIFGTIIAVKEAFLEMAAIKEAIDEKSTKQSETIGGKTINKKDLRKDMSELSAQIGQIIAAYAFANQKEDLKKAVDFPISVYNKKNWLKAL